MVPSFDRDVRTTEGNGNVCLGSAALSRSVLIDANGSLRFGFGYRLYSFGMKESDFEVERGSG